GVDAVRVPVHAGSNGKDDAVVLHRGVVRAFRFDAAGPGAADRGDAAGVAYLDVHAPGEDAVGQAVHAPHIHVAAVVDGDIAAGGVAVQAEGVTKGGRVDI